MCRAAVIVAGARTPFVKAWGAFRRVPAKELGRIAQKHKAQFEAR